MIRDVTRTLEGYADDGDTIEPYVAGDLAGTLHADMLTILDVARCVEDLGYDLNTALLDDAVERLRALAGA